MKLATAACDTLFVLTVSSIAFATTIAASLWWMDRVPVWCPLLCVSSLVTVLITQWLYS